MRQKPAQALDATATMSAPLNATTDDMNKGIPTKEGCEIKPAQVNQNICPY